MHSKIKEKTGKDIIPTVILGACNPNLAYEAYSADSDVASLLPCNAVIRETAPGTISVELAAPSAMMRILGHAKLIALGRPRPTSALRVRSPRSSGQSPSPASEQIRADRHGKCRDRGCQIP